MSKIPIPKKTTAYGYTGLYISKSKRGQLGWCTAKFLGPKRYPGKPDIEEIKRYHKFQRLYLCKIVLTPVIDKKGRPITLIAQRPTKK